MALAALALRSSGGPRPKGPPLLEPRASAALKAAWSGGAARLSTGAPPAADGLGRSAAGGGPGAGGGEIVLAEG